MLSLLSVASLYVSLICLPSFVLSVPVKVPKREYQGQATYFYVGLGACGDTNVASDFIVALATNTYSNGDNCNRSIVITDSMGTSTIATVKDECPSCGDDDLDLSQGLFEYFKGSTEAGVFEMSWEWATEGSDSN